jgi:hypothetical protein
MNALVRVQSDQDGIIARHHGIPEYELHFGNEPLEVLEDVATHLCQNPNFHIITDAPQEQPVEAKKATKKQKNKVNS